jgi:cytochrome c oxidase subunit III
MSVQERNYLVHPQYIMMTLLLAGICALFLGFSISYVYTRVQMGVPPIKLPVLFYFNTLILIAASYFLMSSKKNYKEDDTEAYKKNLTITLMLTIVFLVAQVIAWTQMQSDEIFMNYSTAAAYLYLISILHFAHVVAGIPFLAWFLYQAKTKMVSPVSVLVYFSDTDKKRKLDLLNIYWHFLDILWVLLVVFFLLNYLI